MALALDSSIEQIFGKSGLEITKVVRKSDGLVLWEAYPVGTVEEFNYTGDMQTFTAPATGIYKLGVYGAQGGSTALSGGKGGHSSGYVTLTKGDILYICVGGKGGDTGSGTDGGGYNGGGYGGTGDNAEWSAGGGGGGATHIAKRTGILSELEDYLADILLVAGGGGGSGHSRPGDNSLSYGGTGGGTSGGDGSNARNNYPGKGGTQSAGGAGGNDGNPGSFGQGGSYSNGGYGAGGGGGLYGGGSGGNGNGTMPGGGGSGYIGGVDNGETVNGEREGDGYASVTFYSRKSSGIVTYIVDGVEYEVEVAVGSDCLNPTSFDIPTKDGYAFRGWSYTDGGEVLNSYYMGQSDITLYAIYTEVVPYYVTLTDYSLTDISGAGEDWIVTTNGDGHYYLGALKSTGSIAYARASGSVTLPTNNCNKVRIKYNASYYESRTDLVDINGAGCTTNGTDEYLYLDCSGDDFKLTFSVANPSDYYWVKLTVKEIYFYYE